MTGSTKVFCQILASALVVSALPSSLALGQVGSAFTYQGQLEKNGSSYDGNCDFVFRLWDASTNGQQVGNMQTVNGVAVANGLFTVALDFGATAFSGSARWLESAVQCAGDGGFITLAPRQAITASPYALSLRPGARIEGSIPAGVSFDAGLRVTNSSASNGIGLFGIASATSGVTIGVAGNTASPAGFAVYGNAANGGAAVRGEASNGPGVWGSSVDWLGVHGVSQNQVGVRGESTISAGVFGTSVDWLGVHGISTNQVGVGGESTNFDGVWGVAHAANKAGVVAISNGDNGNGIYATSNAPFGFAMMAEGNVRQALQRGGLVKAMARVENNTIVACYNSQGQGLQIQTPPCGFSVTDFGNGFRHINFGFQVGDRFPVVTPLNFSTAVAGADSFLESGIEQANGTVIAVYAKARVCNGFCSEESLDFFLIVF